MGYTGYPMTVDHELSSARITGLRPPSHWFRHPDYRLVPGDTFGGPQLLGEGPLETFELPAPLVPVVVGPDAWTDEGALKLCRSIGHMGIGKSDLLAPVPLTKAMPLAEDTTGHSESLGDFRTAVGAVAALVLADRAVSGDIPIGAVQSSWPTAAPWDAPASLIEARELLTEEIRRGLLGLTIGVGSTPKDSGNSAVFLCLEGRIGIYAICILELATTLMESRPYKACGRADCGKLFRSGGVRGPGKRRGDSTYCSESCRAAEASRRYRARLP